MCQLVGTVSCSGLFCAARLGPSASMGRRGSWIGTLTGISLNARTRSSKTPLPFVCTWNMKLFSSPSLQTYLRDRHLRHSLRMPLTIPSLAHLIASRRHRNLRWRRQVRRTEALGINGTEASYPIRSRVTKPHLQVDSWHALLHTLRASENLRSVVESAVWIGTEKFPRRAGGGSWQPWFALDTQSIYFGSFFGTAYSWMGPATLRVFEQEAVLECRTFTELVC